MPVYTSKHPDLQPIRQLGLQLALLLLVLGCVQWTEAQANRRPKVPPVDECALFKSNDTVALTHGVSSYIEIGEMYVDDNFNIEMEVLPSPLNHDGILFSIGSKRSFDYYEWRTAAVHTQYLVLEFIFSALALTLKAEGTEHLQQIEVFKTWEVPYYIDDGNYHTIKAWRDKSWWRLMIDGMTMNATITNRTNVQLIGKPAFIGGRPGYTHHQFQGIIRKVKINGQRITLGGRRTSSEHGSSGTAGSDKFVEVWHCGHNFVQTFTSWIKQSSVHSRS